MTILMIDAIIFAGADFYVSSRYGWRTLYGKQNFHQGIDLATNGKNLPMFFFDVGTVTAKGYEATGAGHYIIINVPRLGIRVRYYHVREASALLKVGQTVGIGDLVGYCGTTGNSTGIHLHLGIQLISTGAYVDPEVYFKTYIGPIPVDPVGTPVARDTSKRQVEIKISDLRGRLRPEKNDAVILGYIVPGVYDVIDEKDMRQSGEASNTELWLKLENGSNPDKPKEGLWAAATKAEWVAIYEPIVVPPPMEPTDKDKDAEIAELKNKNNILEEAIDAAVSILNEYIRRIR